MRRFIKSIFRRGADIYPLEGAIQKLQEEVRWLRERIDPKSRNAGTYDLVRLGDIILFMPMYDNLYEHFVPESCKGFTPEQHAQLEHRDPALVDEELRTDVTKLLSLYLEIFFSNGVGVNFLDIGAWVGDVAIRLGKFAKRRGGQFHAVCYDPSVAGALIPFNIELNGLSQYVGFHPVGLSLTGMPQIFSQIVGHSDHSQIASGSVHGASETYLIHTRTLADCFPPDGSRHVMVKIDVEGLDAKLVYQNLDLLRDATLMVEFAPDREVSDAAFIETLRKTHTLFDVYYLPRPTRAARIENVEFFAAEIAKRPYGYTDILGVPHSLSFHDEIVDAISNLKPIAPSNMLA